jgi:hypothetical protein
MSENTSIATQEYHEDQRELARIADEAGPCGECSGDLGLLGTLGNMVWYRCRQCGSEEGAEVDS